VSGYSDDVKRLARRYARHMQIYNAWLETMQNGKPRGFTELSKVKHQCTRAGGHVDRAAQQLALQVAMELELNIGRYWGEGE
jgi:hypothetical protein